MNQPRIGKYGKLVSAPTVAIFLATSQFNALAQTANALFLNQNPAPAVTAPGTALFSGHAGQAGAVGTPAAGGMWLAGSAFGQSLGSDLFWDYSQDLPTDYALGDIPSLTALHGGVVVFTIHSEELGPGATFSFQLDVNTPAPLGQLTLDAATGRFTYAPAPTDRQPFNILITATRNGQTEQQLVEIQPRPLLPPEEDLIRPSHAMPTDDAPEYIVRSEILSNTNENFNGASRKTRDVTVSGKVIVIESGNPNRIWQSYNSVLDLKSLTICAEQVVVRGVWALASTKVVINARAVRYEAGGRIDQAYEVTVNDGDFQWLTPHAVRAVVAYAKDLYLYGFRPEARAVLVDYWDKLSRLEASVYWPVVDETSQMEFGQVTGEIAELLHRLDCNLDYFGHPAGWVPNLSFEANLGLFSSEAESAIRVLYLSYWLGNVASSIQQKAEGMANSRAQLAADFTALTNELGTTQVRLDDLQVKASATESNLTRLNTALTNRVEELRQQAARAAKKSWWRKATKMVGGVLSSVPVYQPILGAVGAGLELVSEIRQPSDLLSLDQSKLSTIAEAFEDGAFDKSVASFKNYLKPLNPSQLGDTGWKQYLKDVYKQGKVIAGDVKKIQGVLKSKEVADSDAQAILTQVKAENPELNRRFGDAQADGLMDQIRGAVKDLTQFNADITDAMQKMARLTGEIERHILAVDSMNRDVSTMNGILDHRAMMHLKEMDRRAKERLRMYQYYLAKSYEYRFLDSYPGELNVNAIFDRMVAIGQAGTSTNGLLSASDFQSLKGVYENELAEVTFAVIQRYQQNPPARSTPVSLVLSTNEMAALNAGEPVRINMVERYRVPVRDEDMRINDIDVSGFTMAINGVPEPNATIWLSLYHSGISKVRSGTNDFLFRHDQQSDMPPFFWEVSYDSNTQEKTPVLPSPSDQSLLKYLLELRGVPTAVSNLMLFTRPGMWSDLQLERFDWPFHMPQYSITNLTLKFSYDFRTKPNNLVALDVSVSDARIAPYIMIDRVDQRGRQDGIGRFYRTFLKGSVVTLTAPPAFGIWQFDRWVDGFGRNLPGGLGTSNVLTLTLDDHSSVQVRYLSTDSDEDGLPDDWERRFFGTLAQAADDDADHDGLVNLGEYWNLTSPISWDTDGDGIGDGQEIAAVTDPADSFRLSLEFDSSGTLRLKWKATAGRGYTVHQTPTLNEPWTEYAYISGPVAGTIDIAYPVPASLASSFFRVISRAVTNQATTPPQTPAGLIAVDEFDGTGGTGWLDPEPNPSSGGLGLFNNSTGNWSSRRFSSTGMTGSVWMALSMKMSAPADSYYCVVPGNSGGDVQFFNTGFDPSLSTYGVHQLGGAYTGISQTSMQTWLYLFDSTASSTAYKVWVGIGTGTAINTNNAPLQTGTVGQSSQGVNSYYRTFGSGATTLQVERICVATDPDTALGR